MRHLDWLPDVIRVGRVDPAANVVHFYSLRLLPNLFGGVSLFREWGQIGTRGRQRVEMFADIEAAANALFAVYRTKRKNGYHLLDEAGFPGAE